MVIVTILPPAKKKTQRMATGAFKKNSVNTQKMKKLIFFLVMIFFLSLESCSTSNHSKHLPWAPPKSHYDNSRSHHERAKKDLNYYFRK
jgi:hypothetical protein